MPDFHSLPTGSRPDDLALEHYKIRELAEGWPCTSPPAKELTHDATETAWVANETPEAKEGGRGVRAKNKH